MKKAIFVLLTAALLLAAVSASAEISVAWSDGTLTVSTTDTVGMNIILIDGVETGKYVGDTSPFQTFSVPEDGQTHTVTTMPYFGAHGGSATFVAGGASGIDPEEDWDEGTVTLEPTCEEDGVILYTDKNHPANTRTEVIPALGHQPETVPGTAATCTETGLTDGEQCAVCGEILKAQEIIPVLGHSPETIPGTAAACTEAGLTDGEQCAVCGEILKAQETIPALGHTPETIPGKDAACTEAGLTDGEQCAVCGEILKAQETIPALGHDYVEQAASLTVKELVCSRCGATEYADAYEPIPNLYAGLLRNARGENVDYVASYDVLNRDTLIITALVDQADENWVSRIGMYLSEQVIARIRAEAFTKVCFVNENAYLTFVLADLTADLFAADQVNEYVITLDPRAEDGCLVRLEAAVAEDRLVAAESFGLMQLTLNDTVLDVSKPGTYSE